MEISYIPQYSLKHIAHMVGVSDRTVRRWFKSGRLIGYRVGGRRSWYASLPEVNRMRKLYALPPLSIDEAQELYSQY